MVVSCQPTKTLYSETEAAEELGITVEQLRSLICSHIVDDDVEPSSFSVSNLYPSDVLVLKILSSVPSTLPD